MAAILVCINMIAAFYHYGLDLTKEKRFTLSEPTKKLLRKMDDVAVIDVYLKGKFPAGFQRLAASTRERLQSFKDVAGNKIVVRFIDPFEGKTEEEKGPIFQQLAAKDINGVNLQTRDEEEGYAEKIIFPYALVKYKGREMPVRLLENNKGFNPLQNLGTSETLLEYKFANALNTLMQPTKPEIAYIIGHGESIGWNTYDLLTTLTDKYKVDTFDLAANMFIPNYYKAIIINKPTEPLDDKEKFKIDQYVMGGGHILWAIDQLFTPMDSLNAGGTFMTLDYDLGLDDQLFKWGVRINRDVIEDLQQCLPIPVQVGLQGDNRPQLQNMPWIYYPVFTPTSSHPIVKNLNAIMGRFVNSMDTVAAPGVKKTILLQSSQYSRVEEFPVRISLSILKYPLTPDMFKKPYRTAAVLLEGKFNSIFEHRLAPSFLHILQDSLKRQYKPVSDSATSMIVISDGDIMDNDFSQSQGPMEMGYWKYINTRFSNKEFILNCLEYLTDPSGILEARSKDLVIRKLDNKRATQEKVKWRIVNIGIPVALVLLFASAFIFFRKRRYEKK
ncbi:MAG: gliding motility-associated ABC transporter substrate-binding protein GldG [Bacteroidetes bacterium 43-93]|nr:MAG: gliding motility-associated ABC transporter substrate-binding protein GldG [Bacteroidetes bacterium 43-93]